ncbi:N-acetylglucosaminyl deacetylase, LmbE family [Meinhardsimonia xiamenensis]|jgi:LmbE family N-acetylglucosaminyl deacetylase|uniref:N-acetylglucosaminyl deacetylase, LmbE family n=1 Tax=Meinhardsimonia xiamenensis TaxID=990712 RepID=A0A1G9HEX0_9RHOB|nr:PIG-L deacetylase family protein [Meinhardsimonia xiamenensis]PRX28363.1 LmbE family N-acetylglucosaminyl deacetylase [Meinhardsimonia xiamenensis]SDL11395.1 N-acetylglucosaminyl deacetylase, LmbE family [Meinhardsimonia xiamenensis]
MTKRNVLVIAAHPDDELLGAGGTIALHTETGDRVTCVVAAAGALKHDSDGRKGVHDQARRAATVLGVEELMLLDFPDQGLDRFSLVEIITPLEEIVGRVRPEVVYLQYGYDINRDHQLLFQAALVATRPLEKFIQAILAFDTVSSTEWAYPRSFVPDTWVDISATLEKKIEAMACYETELRDWPHPRSLHSLRVKAESAGSQVLAEAAECFMTIRRVLRNGQTPV